MAYYEVKDRINKLKTKKGAKGSLSGYGGINKESLIAMLRSMLVARRLELEEKLLLRKGLCKFVIGCGGKELIDVVSAELLNIDDPQVGYYRNKAFDMHRGVSIKEKIYEAVGDVRGTANGGMLQPAHSNYPDLAILPQASPTGSHALEAAGLGEAIKSDLPITGTTGYPGGRFPKDAVVINIIGEGASSSPEFGRAVFNAVHFGARTIFAIYNCGWAIATSVDEQFPDGNPTVPYEGYKRFGLLIKEFDGTDIKDAIKGMKKIISHVRDGKGPAMANINVVRLESHSGSDDQSHYMVTKEQNYHIDNDPIIKTAEQYIKDGIMTKSDIIALFDEIDHEVHEISAVTTKDIHLKKPYDVLGKVYAYNPKTAAERWQKLVEARRQYRIDKYKEFHKLGIFDTPELPENRGPMTLRKAITFTLFDFFILSDDTLLFGQDVADFPRDTYSKGEKALKGLRGKGGVFLATQNLQRAFGPDRVFNAPLDEAGILGRAIGHAYQGRIPFPEIQFIDYMSPGYQQLKDRIATAYQRSNTHIKLPLLIRTSYGGYKQGAGSMWHSEANLGAFINIPGLFVNIPSNASDAVRLMRSAFVSDTPTLNCEAVALYNRPNWDGYNLLRDYPPIDDLLELGKAKVYNSDRSDLLIVTYGITAPLCLKLAEDLYTDGVNARVIDLRTVKPIDWATIGQSVKDCSRVLIVSEDRFHGGVGATISAYINEHHFEHLDAPVKVMHAEDARVAYGKDGDEICLPTAEKIKTAAKELIEY